MVKRNLYSVHLPDDSFVLRSAESLLHLKLRLKEEFPTMYQAAQCALTDATLQVYYLSKQDAECWMVAPEIDFCLGILEAWGEVSEDWKVEDITATCEIPDIPTEPALYTPERIWRTI